MLKESPKYKSFTRLCKTFEGMDGIDRQRKILELITKQYLNAFERGYYEALKLNYEGKKQQDICLSFNTFQSYLSKRLKLLIKKLQVLGFLLGTNDIQKQFIEAKTILSDRQIIVLNYVLLGYSQKKIAKNLKVTAPAVSYIYKKLIKILMKHGYKTLSIYLSEYKNFLI